MIFVLERFDSIISYTKNFSFLYESVFNNKISTFFFFLYESLIGSGKRGDYAMILRVDIETNFGYINRRSIQNHERKGLIVYIMVTLSETKSEKDRGIALV